MRRVRPQKGIAERATAHLFSSEIAAVDVPYDVLNDDAAINRYLNMHAGYSDEVFALSMTYGSDSFARSLGINPVELPCLVFIDDPKSSQYYLMSMSLSRSG
jgi:hypothetical protein